MVGEGGVHWQLPRLSPWAKAAQLVPSQVRRECELSPDLSNRSSELGSSGSGFDDIICQSVRGGGGGGRGTPGMKEWRPGQKENYKQEQEEGGSP